MISKINDIELINLAAKAMNIKVEWSRPYVATGDFAQVPNWDPLSIDADAISIAIKFGWYDCINPDGKTIRTWTGETTPEAVSKTRRAITEKAAKIRV